MAGRPRAPLQEPVRPHHLEDVSPMPVCHTSVPGATSSTCWALGLGNNVVTGRGLGLITRTSQRRK